MKFARHTGLLREGGMYRLLDGGVLMPSREPLDPIAAIEMVRHIHSRATFKVVEVAPQSAEILTPWYRVMFPGTAITGWINSTNLLDKRIEVMREET